MLIIDENLQPKNKYNWIGKLTETYFVKQSFST